MTKQTVGLETERNYRIIKDLRRCGHFLHFNTGGKCGQRRILTYLLRHGPMSQKALQQQLEVQSGSLSEILAKIAGEGFLRREVDSRDRRQLLLCLTKSGQRRAEALEQEYRQLLTLLLEKLDAEQQQSLLELLDIITEHWQQIEIEQQLARAQQGDET